MADNVDLSIRAFSCASFEARGTQKATFDAIWFQNLCVHGEGENRPVVYVNGPHFYFNVTKSLVVQDVVFDGINAFGRIERAQEPDYYDAADADFYGPGASLRAPSWTERLCELDTPDGF